MSFLDSLLVLLPKHTNVLQVTYFFPWCQPPYQLMATRASSLTRQVAMAKLAPATHDTYSNRPVNGGQSYPINQKEATSRTSSYHTPQHKLSTPEFLKSSKENGWVESGVWLLALLLPTRACVQMN